MKSSQYWKNRSAKRMYEYHTEADKVADDIAQAYIDSTNYINNEIEKIFRTFQIEGGLTESEARELLNNTPGQVKLANLKDYIKQVKDPEKQQTLLNMINSPAYSYRIKRFERLQEDIDRQTRELAEFEQKTTKNHYVQLSGEAYNRTMFDIQRGIGFGFPFSKMPVSRIEEILKNNWSGQHFSARIWGRAEEINQTLKEELLTQFMTGRSYRKTAAEISDRMAVGAYEARRLVRTESTYIANSAELESYKECGIEQFRFLATLDMRISDLCASMDGKVFSVEEGVPGTNIPPLHPWCRSTTVAVIDGAVLSDLKRRARDPETGKPYLVSADTTYEEWKKELDQRFGEGYSTTKRKMVQNRAKDGKQYQNYLSVLGKENMPKSLDEFQNLKYNNSDEWDDLKYYVRNINGRPIEYVKIDRELLKKGIIKKGKAYPVEDIVISDWRDHARDRINEINFTEEQALKFKENAIAVMRKFPEPETQWNYYSDDGIIGIRHSDGLVCTIIDKNRYRNETKEILKEMKKWLT